jgi:mRNA-degrading endonuclease RelE of RelBE toxin-antitoxin system
MKPPVEVIPSPWFAKRIKKLRKRYPQIAQDTLPLIEQLKRGETPGDHLQAKRYTLYKVRVPNRDARRGKSGGYRVVYYIQTQDRVILLTIYTKSDQNDISLEEIEAIIADLPDNGEE